MIARIRTPPFETVSQLSFRGENRTRDFSVRSGDGCGALAHSDDTLLQEKGYLNHYSNHSRARRIAGTS